MSKLLSFPNDLGSLFERFADETKYEDYDCVGAGGGSVEIELTNQGDYPRIIADFKAYLNKAVDEAEMS